MTLKNLIKQLKDLELLFKDGVIIIKNQNEEYKITDIQGYSGKSRPYECPDPNEIIINIKKG